MKEVFPNKVTVSRAAKKNEFLQRYSSETKFKVPYLTSCEKKVSGYFLMVARAHYR